MRYEFGKNWSDFLTSNFSDEKVKNAGAHMLRFLGTPNLKDLRFLDIGCGSGIHSLAALLAGAESVTSFDFDKNSVDAAKSIKKIYGEPENWTILEGSILDPTFTKQLERYDIVYSWGVLHHTGDMWAAIEAAHALMKKDSLFYIALYSKEVFVNPSPEYWIDLKQRYNQCGKIKRTIMEWFYAVRFFIWQDIRSNLKNIIVLMLRLASGIINAFGEILTRGKIHHLGNNIVHRVMPTKLIPYIDYPYSLAPFKNPFKYFSKKGRAKGRGMDFWTDIRDWLGGYPMEFAGNSETKNFCKEKLGLEILNIQAGEACTEYLFCQKEDKENLSFLIPYKEKLIMRGPFNKFGSVGWKFEIPKEIAEKIRDKTPSKRSLMILESSTPLGWEIKAESEQELSIIGEEGKGRHAVINNWLYFSASDNTSPRNNGRIYEIGILSELDSN